MKKKLFAFFCCVMLLATSLSCFAPTPVAASAANNQQVGPSPMISTWLYQNNTPIVGTRSQYNTYISSTNRSYALQSFVLSIGLTGLTTYLSQKLPVKSLGKSIAAMVFSAIQSTKSLDTPTLYSNETRWGMDGSSSINYQVIQKWYSDSAHTKYVCTTIYYCSFV